MKKVSEINAVLQHIFSSNRRNKATILIKEWWLGLPLRFKSKLNVDSELPPDSDVQRWTSHETRKIDPDYYKRGSGALVEDQINDSGLVKSELNYSIQRLYGASVYTNETTHRSIFDRHGRRIEQLSSIRNGSRVGVPSRRLLPVSKTVPGVTANLYGAIASAEGNYLHWFVDTLARLFLIERFYSIDEIDHLLVPPLKYDFHWDSLEAFGFKRSQIIELHPLETIQFECLLATSEPRGKGSSLCPGWVIDRYKDTLLEKASTTESVAGKRVFISRRDAPTRMFGNEDDVCALMEARGYDIVELTPLNLWQKIAVFRDAEYLVSQTGAGLTNLMFCSSNANVLELVDEKFVYPLYASMAVYSGGSHKAHFFNSQSALSKVNAMVAKSWLDIDAFDKALRRFEE